MLGQEEDRMNNGHSPATTTGAINFFIHELYSRHPEQRPDLNCRNKNRRIIAQSIRA